MSALATRSVGVRFGRRVVLDEVSLALRPGEVTAILGPNGAGKSTLLDILAGLRRPDEGDALLDGAPLAALPARARARSIAYLSQNPEIAWSVDVRTLVGLGRTAHLGAWGPGAEDRAAVEAALVATGMQGFAGRVVQTLSGGERARALIARALAGRPQWLLADEPFAGLDPGHVLDAIELFRDLAKGEGLGIVVTLHDLGAALKLADRLLVLAEARIVADGAPAAALTPAVMARAYGVEARLAAGEVGPLIEVLGRAR